MSHTNYHRPPKIRKPVPRKPNKIIVPDSVYSRKKERVRMQKIIKNYT